MSRFLVLFRSILHVECNGATGFTRFRVSTPVHLFSLGFGRVACMLHACNESMCCIAMCHVVCCPSCHTPPPARSACCLHFWRNRAILHTLKVWQTFRVQRLGFIPCMCCFSHNFLETARNVMFLGSIPLHFARRMQWCHRLY